MKMETARMLEAFVRSAVCEEDRAEVLGLLKGRAARRKCVSGVEAARVLGVHRKTVANLDKRGELHAVFRKGPRVRYALDEVEDAKWRLGYA